MGRRIMPSSEPVTVALPPHRWPIPSTTQTILATWTADPAFSTQTRARMGELLQRFATRAESSGIDSWLDVGENDAIGFIRATTKRDGPPAPHTQHARRTTLRAAFRTLKELGAPVHDPTWNVTLPARSHLQCRPLTDDEVILLRHAARLGGGAGSLRRAVALALAEATAVTSEISAVTADDIDDPVSPQWVRLPGTTRHAARLGQLSSWGSAIVARHVAELADGGTDPRTPLVYGGRAVPGQAAAQASLCNTVRLLLAQCGLAAEPDVRPGSVRAWAGRRLFDGGAGIDEVARRLGVGSLDTAAAVIGWDWRGSR